MVGAVVQRHIDVADRIAGQNPVARGFLDPVFHRRDVLLRDRAADHLADELDAAVALAGLHDELDVAILPATAGLLDELPGGLGLARDGLLIGHLRPARLGPHLELALQPVEDNLQVQLPHAGDDRLRRFLVVGHAERRVLVLQDAETQGQPVLIHGGLWLNGQRDHRVREVHEFQDHQLVLVAHRLARLGVVQPDGRRDVARRHLLNDLLLVRMQPDELPHPVPLPAVGVVHVAASGEPPGVDPDEVQLPHERVARDLVDQSAERLGHQGLALLHLP